MEIMFFSFSNLETENLREPNAWVLSRIHPLSAYWTKREIGRTITRREVLMDSLDYGGWG